MTAREHCRKQAAVALVVAMLLLLLLVVGTAGLIGRSPYPTPATDSAAKGPLAKVANWVEPPLPRVITRHELTAENY